MKGSEREASLAEGEYFSDYAFSLTQLSSFAHQLHIIWNLRPKKVLEVGIGNGVVSTVLRRSGIGVITADINPNLGPDIVSSIENLPTVLLDKDFDLVVCCEVLEHLPFEKFEASIRVLSEFSRNLFITLPCYEAWLGVGGFLRLPRMTRAFSVGVRVGRHKDLEPGVHFWELGSAKSTKRANIKKTLEKYYSSVVHGVFHLNRYHEYFICATKPSDHRNLL